MTASATVPGIGRDLTPPQALACALRILAHEGWQENLSGHITWADDRGQALWVNPWGLWWSEVRARDIMRVSFDGSILSGPWDVTPVVFIHTELHRARPDARMSCTTIPTRRPCSRVSEWSR
jgi:ribulose-5-phosphate 4-epimerase/fuculose-1-phosphate aldolase